MLSTLSRSLPRALVGSPLVVPKNPMISMKLLYHEQAILYQKLQYIPSQVLKTGFNRSAMVELTTGLQSSSLLRNTSKFYGRNHDSRYFSTAKSGKKKGPSIWSSPWVKVIIGGVAFIILSFLAVKIVKTTCLNAYPNFIAYYEGTDQSLLGIGINPDKIKCSGTLTTLIGAITAQNYMISDSDIRNAPAGLWQEQPIPVSFEELSKMIENKQLHFWVAQTEEAKKNFIGTEVVASDYWNTVAHLLLTQQENPAIIQEIMEGKRGYYVYVCPECHSTTAHVIPMLPLYNMNLWKSPYGPLNQWVIGGKKYVLAKENKEVKL